MIVVRNVFRLKFGKSREAVAAFKEGISQMQKMGPPGMSTRLLTDLVSSFYTVVLEHAYPSMADFETNGKAMMAREEWKAWYQKLVPLIDSGYREIFTLVE